MDMLMDAKTYLQQARQAVKDGDDGQALAHFEYFFDHALAENQAWRGVRLSYCLMEWFDLGQRYAPARERFMARQADILSAFEQSQEPELFNEYRAMHRLSQQGETPLAIFINLDQHQPQLALQCSEFLWLDLLADHQWQLAYRYMGSAKKRYDMFWYKWDMALTHISQQALSKEKMKASKVAHFSYVHTELKLFLMLLEQIV